MYSYVNAPLHYIWSQHTLQRLSVLWMALHVRGPELFGCRIICVGWVVLSSARAHSPQQQQQQHLYNQLAVVIQSLHMSVNLSHVHVRESFGFALMTCY